MASLEIVRGVPGCGKSTYAATTGKSVINRDSIRKMLFGSEDAFGVDEELVTEIQNTLLKHYLSKDYDVIVDNTNIEWQHVKALAAIAHQYGADVKITVLDVGLEEALRRNADRATLGGRFVPVSVIENMYERLEKTKGWAL